jgi:2,5-diamino-6-(ribosylamino)-4(3H)-pyrimidinone 5'-phosphate reductase
VDVVARHLPPNELPPQSSTPVRQPQPVILDTRLRMPLTSRLLDPARHASGDCLPPWIMVGEGLVDPIRQQQVEARGARVFPVAVQANGRLDFMAVLQKLKALGIRRVMVEGGSQVIRQLLLSSTEQSSLVDLLIVTIAPVFVGEQGVSALGEQSMTSQHVCYPNLNVLEYATFTPDIVMVATMKSSQSSSHIHHQ